MPNDLLKNADKPKEPRFVAIAGDLYEIDDIIDALHGRSFMATLHIFDLQELGQGARDPNIVNIAQRQKTAALQRIVAQSTDGLRDNLPNRAAILMALEKNSALRFNTITEFIAQFAQLTPADASSVAAAANEVHGEGLRVLDGTQPLGGRFSQPTGHSFFNGRFIQSALGEGWVGGVWAQVNTAIVERALTGQSFTDDDWVQMFSGDDARNEISRGSTMSLKERTSEYATRGFVGGATLTVASLPVVFAVGEPMAIIAPAGFMALTAVSAATSVVIQATPDSWLMWIADKAAAVRRSTRSTSASSRRAAEFIPRYKKLFEITKARIEELRKTPSGQVNLLLIQEILGQEGGVFTRDEGVLEMLRKWGDALQRSKVLRERFDDLFEGYPPEAFSSAKEARQRFIEFNSAQKTS
ncbi:MAG: hypothetical protein WC777_02645 [Candidatus Gracilibacteria bacterium]|jgi:hypothetical protein